MLPLFAYGTLRDPDLLAAVLGRPVADRDLVEATAPGYRTALYPGRVYPALVVAPSTAVEGLLIYGLSPREEEILDLFEGDEYRRGELTVSAGGTEVPATVYWPDAAIAADAPQWHLAEWQRNHKLSVLVSETEAAAEIRARLTART